MAKGATINLLPTVLNLAIYSGDGLRLRLIVKDSAQAPVPLGPLSISSQIRQTRADADPKATFGVDLTDEASGIAIISLTGEQTASLANFNGVWDVQWKPIDAEPRTILQGSLTCESDVTR